MDDKLTFLGFLRWLRDEAGAFIASFWMILALYALGLWLVYAFLQVDAEFSRPLAGGVIPPDVTQQFAWAVRGFSILCGMAAMWCHFHDMPKWRNTVVWLGIVAGLILFLHAAGLSAKIMEGQYARAAVIETAGEVRSAGIDRQIVAIDGQIAGIRGDRDVAIATAEAGIASIKDEVPGLSADDNASIRAFQADKEDAQQRAAERIAELEGQKLALLASAGAVTLDTAERSALADAFNPLFTVLARVTSWTWDPNADPPRVHQYMAGIAFFTVFWGFGEILMMTLFPVAYGMQLKAAMQARERREQLRRSEAGRKSWETRRESEKREAEERDRTVMPLVQAGSDKDLNRETYWRDAVDEMITWRQDRQPKVTFKRLVEKFGAGRTAPEFSAGLDHALRQGWVSRDRYETLMQIPTVRNGGPRTEDGGEDEQRPAAGG